MIDNILTYVGSFLMIVGIITVIVGLSVDGIRYLKEKVHHG